jgi:hypothetical protein
MQQEPFSADFSSHYKQPARAVWKGQDARLKSQPWRVDWLVYVPPSHLP